MFRFTVENIGQKGEAIFLGQGDNMEEAIKDARKGALGTFRPKNDGQPRPSIGVMVRYKDGTVAKKSLAEFEAPASSEVEF